MTDITERDYFAVRAEVARRLEVQAVHPSVAAIHRAMAERYEALASGLADLQRIEAAGTPILI